MTHRLALVPALLSTCLAAFTPRAAQAQGVNRYGNPARMRPAPTASAITVRDLQIRLYQFADDSMQGRQVGRVGNRKGTDYIAAELRRSASSPRATTAPTSRCCRITCAASRRTHV